MTRATTVTRPRLRWAMPCDLGSVREAGERVKRFLLEQGCTETEVVDCQLALTEACNNAVQYVSSGRECLPVEIEAGCENEWIELQVTDHTGGMEWPRDVPLPAITEEHGRGLYIIKAVMNETAYVSGTGENRFVLRRRRELPRR